MKVSSKQKIFRKNGMNLNEKSEVLIDKKLDAFLQKEKMLQKNSSKGNVKVIKKIKSNEKRTQY